MKSKLPVVQDPGLDYPEWVLLDLLPETPELAAIFGISLWVKQSLLTPGSRLISLETGDLASEEPQAYQPGPSLLRFLGHTYALGSYDPASSSKSDWEFDLAVSIAEPLTRNPRQQVKIVSGQIALQFHGLFPGTEAERFSVSTGILASGYSDDGARGFGTGRFYLGAQSVAFSFADPADTTATTASSNSKYLRYVCSTRLPYTVRKNSGTETIISEGSLWEHVTHLQPDDGSDKPPPDGPEIYYHFDPKNPTEGDRVKVYTRPRQPLLILGTSWLAKTAKKETDTWVYYEFDAVELLRQGFKPPTKSASTEFSSSVELKSPPIPQNFTQLRLIGTEPDDSLVGDALWMRHGEVWYQLKREPKDLPDEVIGQDVDRDPSLTGPLEFERDGFSIRLDLGRQEFGTDQIRLKVTVGSNSDGADLTKIEFSSDVQIQVTTPAVEVYRGPLSQPDSVPGLAVLPSQLFEKRRLVFARTERKDGAELNLVDSANSKTLQLAKIDVTGYQRPATRATMLPLSPAAGNLGDALAGETRCYPVSRDARQGLVKTQVTTKGSISSNGFTATLGGLDEDPGTWVSLPWARLDKSLKAILHHRNLLQEAGELSLALQDAAQLRGLTVDKVKSLVETKFQKLTSEDGQLQDWLTGSDLQKSLTASVDIGAAESVPEVQLKIGDSVKGSLSVTKSSDWLTVTQLQLNKGKIEGEYVNNSDAPNGLGGATGLVFEQGPSGLLVEEPFFIATGESGAWQGSLENVQGAQRSKAQSGDLLIRWAGQVRQLFPGDKGVKSRTLDESDKSKFPPAIASERPRKDWQNTQFVVGKAKSGWLSRDGRYQVFVDESTCGAQLLVKEQARHQCSCPTLVAKINHLEARQIQHAAVHEDKVLLLVDGQLRLYSACGRWLQSSPHTRALVCLGRGSIHWYGLDDLGRLVRFSEDLQLSEIIGSLPQVYADNYGYVHNTAEIGSIVRAENRTCLTGSWGAGDFVADFVELKLKPDGTIADGGAFPAGHCRLYRQAQPGEPSKQTSFWPRWQGLAVQPVELQNVKVEDDVVTLLVRCRLANPLFWTNLTETESADTTGGQGVILEAQLGRNRVLSVGLKNSKTHHFSWRLQNLGHLVEFRGAVSETAADKLPQISVEEVIVNFLGVPRTIQLPNGSSVTQLVWSRGDNAFKKDETHRLSSDPLWPPTFGLDITVDWKFQFLPTHDPDPNKAVVQFSNNNYQSFEQLGIHTAFNKIGTASDLLLLSQFRNLDLHLATLSEGSLQHSVTILNVKVSVVLRWVTVTAGGKKTTRLSLIASGTATNQGSVSVCVQDVLLSGDAGSARGMGWKITSKLYYLAFPLDIELEFESTAWKVKSAKIPEGIPLLARQMVAPIADGQEDCRLSSETQTVALQLVNFVPDLKVPPQVVVRVPTNTDPVFKTLSAKDLRKLPFSLDQDLQRLQPLAEVSPEVPALAHLLTSQARRTRARFGSPVLTGLVGSSDFKISKSYEFCPIVETDAGVFAQSLGLWAEKVTSPQGIMVTQNLLVLQAVPEPGDVEHGKVSQPLTSLSNRTQRTSPPLTAPKPQVPLELVGEFQMAFLRKLENGTVSYQKAGLAVPFVAADPSFALSLSDWEGGSQSLGVLLPSHMAEPFKRLQTDFRYVPVAKPVGTVKVPSRRAGWESEVAGSVQILAQEQVLYEKSTALVPGLDFQPPTIAPEENAWPFLPRATILECGPDKPGGTLLQKQQLLSAQGYGSSNLYLQRDPQRLVPPEGAAIALVDYGYANPVMSLRWREILGTKKPSDTGVSVFSLLQEAPKLFEQKQGLQLELPSGQGMVSARVHAPLCFYTGQSDFVIGYKKADSSVAEYYSSRAECIPSTSLRVWGGQLVWAAGLLRLTSHALWLVKVDPSDSNRTTQVKFRSEEVLKFCAVSPGGEIAVASEKSLWILDSKYVVQMRKDDSWSFLGWAGTSLVRLDGQTLYVGNSSVTGQTNSVAVCGSEVVYLQDTNLKLHSNSTAHADIVNNSTLVGWNERVLAWDNQNSSVPILLEVKDRQFQLIRIPAQTLAGRVVAGCTLDRNDYLALRVGDRQLWIWNLQEKRRERVFYTAGKIAHASLSESKVQVSTEDGLCQNWNWKTGTLDCSEDVFCLYLRDLDQGQLFIANEARPTNTTPLIWPVRVTTGASITLNLTGISGGNWVAQSNATDNEVTVTNATWNSEKRWWAINPSNNGSQTLQITAKAEVVIERFVVFQQPEADSGYSVSVLAPQPASSVVAPVLRKMDNAELQERLLFFGSSAAAIAPKEVSWFNNHVEFSAEGEQEVQLEATPGGHHLLLVKSLPDGSTVASLTSQCVETHSNGTLPKKHSTQRPQKANPAQDFKQAAQETKGTK